MAEDDALNDSQADTGALELLGQMQALKDTKELMYILHFESGAVVLNEYLHQLTIPVDPTDFDLGLRTYTAELDRVRDEVHKDQLEHGAIPVAGRKIVDFPGDGTPPCLLPQIRHHLLDEQIEVDASLLCLCSANPGEGKQVIDQVTHFACGFHNRAKVPPAFVVERS